MSNISHPEQALITQFKHHFWKKPVEGKMRILVVDDDQESLKQVSHFLKEKGSEVRTAENKLDALKLYKKQKFDGVYSGLHITDPKLPSLLEDLKKINAYVPFIILSRQQRPQDVLKALSEGACDFLTKPLKVTELERSLHKLKSLNEDTKFTMYCLENSVLESRSLEIGNDYEYVNRIVAFITRNIPSYGLLKDADLPAMNIVLGEALENAIFHGNLELSSELKQERFEAFHEEGERRKNLEPYKDRKVYIRYSISRNSITFVIRDEGHGFDYSKLPDPRSPENIFEASGRGILMILNYMDEVFWNTRGNEITMVRYKKRKLPFFNS